MLYHYRPPLMSQKNSIFPYCSILIFLSNFNCDRITSPKSSFQFPVSSSSLNFGRNQISPNFIQPTKSNKISVASNENVLMHYSLNLITVHLSLIVSTPRVKNSLCLLLLQLRGFNHFRRLLLFILLKGYHHNFEVKIIFLIKKHFTLENIRKVE